MRELMLTGCATRPLGSYLKGLGVLRVLAEQADEYAEAAWPADTLQLTTHLERSRLEDFFLDHYRPTPIVSPWNKSSGFDGKPVPEVDRILETDAPRLLTYQQTIAQARQVVAAMDGGDKLDVLLRCRATLPDSALPWLDAAVVLTEERPAYPPLLGTGGNLGRLELSRNYMGHLARVLCLETGRRAPTLEHSRAWLRAALFDEGHPSLVQQSIAQFDPGAAGGANMAALGKAESVVNPWDYVLLLEGAVLFASAVARRLGTDSAGTAAMPFTTRPTPVGYTSNAEEPAKGEFWAPVWRRPMTLPELAYFLGEGRADWQGRQARTGLDFARAVASLGTDRGVDRFVRHAFVERLGQMTLAVPVGVVAVRDRPEVRVLGQLDNWMTRVGRSKNIPAGVASALRRVEQAMYAVASDGGTENLRRTLTETARLHHAVSCSPSGRERVHPLTEAKADDWLASGLDDGSDEFAVAAGLASAQDRDASLRRLLTAVAVDPRGRLRWSDQPAPVTGLGTRHVAEVLADALRRHAVDRGRADRRANPPEALDHLGHGLDLHFAFQRSTALSPILRAAGGRLDSRRLSELLGGLLLLDWRVRDGTKPYHPAGAMGPSAMTPAAAVTLPFFHGQPVSRRSGRVLLRADPAWPQLLAVGQVAAVLDGALRRLRIAGFDVPPIEPQAASSGMDGRWLAVAALCRLRQPDAQQLLMFLNPTEPE